MSIDQGVETSLVKDPARAQDKSPLGLLLAGKSEVTPELAGAAIRELTADYEKTLLKRIREGDMQHSDEEFAAIHGDYEAWQKKYLAWQGKLFTLKGKTSTGISYRDLYQSCVHDTGVFMTILGNAFNSDITEYFPAVRQLMRLFVDKDVFWLPTLTLERYARHILNEVQEVPFSPQKPLEKIAAFFQKTTDLDLGITEFVDGNYEEAQQWKDRQAIKLELQGEMPMLVGDEVEFTTVLLNLGRNGQKRIKKLGDEIVFRAGREDREFVLRCTDNLGGFPERLLLPVVGTNLRGEETNTQEAFLPGVKAGDTAGTGVGLNIVRTIVEDGFGGKVTAWNNGNNPKGAIVESRLPLKTVVKK